MGKQGMNWTRMLAEAGLEAPGYEETCRAADLKTQQRKADEAAGLLKKSKRKKKK
mgnify:CR=1 FL=1